MDTRGELAEWRMRVKYEKARVVIGAEAGFIGLSMIQRNYWHVLGDDFPFYKSIEETADAAVKLAWFRNDTLAATRHASQLARIATQAATPYWSVIASFCQGLADSTAGDFGQADGFLQRALDASRHGCIRFYSRRPFLAPDIRERSV